MLWYQKEKQRKHKMHFENVAVRNDSIWDHTIRLSMEKVKHTPVEKEKRQMRQNKVGQIERTERGTK